MHGNPTTDDLDTLAKVISDLNELVGSLRLELVEENANVDMHFALRSKFPSILPESSIESALDGFIWVWWYKETGIYKATVLIASDQAVSQKARSSVIREELTQMLGLLNDSYSYPESIFYQESSAVTEFPDIDREVIRILYHDDVVPGMTREDVLALFDAD